MVAGSSPQIVLFDLLLWKFLKKNKLRQLSELDACKKNIYIKLEIDPGQAGENEELIRMSQDPQERTREEAYEEESKYL